MSTQIIAPEGTHPYPGEMMSTNKGLRPAGSEKEPSCSDELEKMLAEDGKKFFYVIYQTKNHQQKRAMIILAKDKDDALEKFNEFNNGFSHGLTSNQVNSSLRQYKQKQLKKMGYVINEIPETENELNPKNLQRDKATLPEVYTEEEFAALKKN